MTPKTHHAKLGLVLTLALLGCGPSTDAASDPVSDPTLDAAEVEAVAQTFYSSLQGDFAVIESMVTPDFDIVDAGQWMDTAGFRTFVADAKAAGFVFDFALSDFATKVSGEVAYTTFVARNQLNGDEFFETVILRRSGDGWLVDRLHSTPRRGP